MWYVIQVMTGDEEKIALMCRKLIGTTDDEDGVLQSCFIPCTKRQRRYRGEWHMEQRPLCPGYVFLVSGRPEELFLQLKHVPGLTKLLGTGWEFVPLTEAEEEFLQRLGGDDTVVEMSTGVSENDRIIVKGGPLIGMEGYIKKIDRHKRIARLEVEMMGRVMEIQVGLEIVEKIKL